MTPPQRARGLLAARTRRLVTPPREGRAGHWPLLRRQTVSGERKERRPLPGQRRPLPAERGPLLAERRPLPAERRPLVAFLAILFIAGPLLSLSPAACSGPPFTSGRAGAGAPGTARHAVPGAPRRGARAAARRASPGAVRRAAPGASRRTAPGAVRRASPGASRRAAPRASRRASPGASRHASPRASRRAVRRAVCRATPGAARRVAPRAVRRAASLRLLEQARGRFGRVFVVQRGGVRYLRFGFPDAEDQSAYVPAHPEREPLDYIRAALLGLAWAPRGPGRPRVLVIGLGGGSFLRHARRLAPRARLAAVEIDPVVARLARRWFGLSQLRGLQVHLADGKRYLARHRARRDLVFLDAYDDDDYPKHLGTLAFFRLLRARLSRRGVAVANLSPNRRALRDRLLRRFRAVFPRTRCLHTPQGNTVVFGGPAVARTPAARLGARRTALARRAHRAGARYGFATMSRWRCGARGPTGSSKRSQADRTR